MEQFNYKNVCGVHQLHTHIEEFKEELAWAIDKQLWVSSNVILLKTVMPLMRKLKNKAILSLKQYCMHCYVVLSNVF